MVIHSHLLQAFGSGAVITCFYDFGPSRLGLEYPTFRLRGERSKPLHVRLAILLNKVRLDALTKSIFQELYRSLYPIHTF